jgi:hypothetical protein
MWIGSTPCMGLFPDQRESLARFTGWPVHA